MFNVASTSKSRGSTKGASVPWARKYKAILRDYELRWLETHSAKEESAVVEMTLKAVQDAHATAGQGAPLPEDLKTVSNDLFLSSTLIMKLNG